jgi:hypothetical protein
MKSEILSKIGRSGDGDQLEDILKEIKSAADEIIEKHKTAPPPKSLTHNNAFSFTDQMDDNPLAKP